MKRGRTNRRSGFTLIEIMVVIVIIMILVGIVIGASKYAHTKAATSRAQAETAMMENALESYKSDNGIYPPSDVASINRGAAIGNAKNDSISLYAALALGPKVYMTFKPEQTRVDQVTGKTYIIDPFGAPYNYYCHPIANDQKNSVTFDLWSYGPDGQNGTPDDITNWQQ